MDITTILAIIIGLIFTILGTLITKAVIPWVKANASETQQELLSSVAESAVLYVQQTMETASGAEKFAAAAEAVTSYFAKYNMTLTAKVLETEIESALKALKIEAGNSWYTEDTE